MAVEQSGAEPSPEGASTASATESRPPDAATQPEAAAEPDGGEADFDDMKRKFREALERKRGTQSTANAEGAHDTGKVHGSHGPASVRRSFRRKSGS